LNININQNISEVAFMTHFSTCVPIDPWDLSINEASLLFHEKTDILIGSAGQILKGPEASPVQPETPSPPLTPTVGPKIDQSEDYH
jgi:hypothetical protein